MHGLDEVLEADAAAAESREHVLSEKLAAAEAAAAELAAPSDGEVPSSRLPTGRRAAAPALSAASSAASLAELQFHTRELHAARVRRLQAEFLCDHLAPPVPSASSSAPRRTMLTPRSVHRANSRAVNSAQCGPSASGAQLGRGAKLGSTTSSSS